MRLADKIQLLPQVRRTSDALISAVRCRRAVLRASIPLLCGLLLGSSGGCKLFAAPYLLWGEEDTEVIPADYPFLDNTRVAVLVNAEPATRFEFPYVQLELANFVATEMQQRLNRCEVVPPSVVAQYQERELDWARSHPAKHGAFFNSEFVLLIDLTQYRTTEPDSPHLFRGIIDADVRLYEVSYGDEYGPVKQWQIAAQYPEDGPAAWGESAPDVRRRAMESFATEMAGKFYERKVKATLKR